MMTSDKINSILGEIPELSFKDRAEGEADFLMMSCIELITASMEADDVSIANIAKIMGKSRSHVSQILNLQRNPSFKDIGEFAAALNISIEANKH